MLDALVNDLGIDFDIIRGVSVGALNGAVLAQAAKQPDSLGNLTLMLQCAVERRVFSVGANPTRQLSLSVGSSRSGSWR